MIKKAALVASALLVLPIYGLRFSVVRLPTHRCAPTCLATNDGDDASTTNYDRLKAEAENPFRVLRRFLYGAAGANAALGGFIALTQLGGTLGNAPSALPLTQVGTNLAVDFGVVGLALVAFKFDSEGSVVAVAPELEARAAAKLTEDEVEARAAMLGTLPISVVATEAGEVREAAVGDAMALGGQHVVIVCGSAKVIEEALVKAKILGDRFAKQGILVVPCDLALVDAAAASGGGGSRSGGGGGFGKDAFADNPYVAQPVLSGTAAKAWSAYCGAELASAAAQAGTTEGEMRIRGIAVVASRSDGKVVRRGLGVPDWGLVIKDLAGGSDPKGK